MEKLVNLKDLLIEQTKDLYSSERMQLKALPKLKQQATSKRLQEAIDGQIEETKRQVEKLEQAFSYLNVKPKEEPSKGVKSLIEQSTDLTKRSADPEVKDAALINAIQHLNHYEIAGYGSTAAYARTLDQHNVANIMHELMEQEKKRDAKFSDIAESEVNLKAKSGSLQ